LHWQRNRCCHRIRSKKKQKLSDFIPSRLFIYHQGRSMEHSVPLDNRRKSVTEQKASLKQGACPETVWPYDDTPAD
jgi:hypothetical protein